MPMIPKPMTDINSESAYEKLKFIPEHYNEIMAAYTDIMEHLKLPVMADTGGGGSGEECLHEVVEVTNPCPAYIQYNFIIASKWSGFYYTNKDSYGDYNTDDLYLRGSNNKTVNAFIMDAFYKYNREYSNNAIPLTGYYSDDYKVFPRLTGEYSELVYTVILLDKTTGEPVEGIGEYYEFNGYEEVTYDTISEVYDIKLALAKKGNYSYEPIILGDFYEKLVELRNSVDISGYPSKLPTPEELCRILNIGSGYYASSKFTIKLLTEEERAEVRSHIHMNTSGNVPPDTPYMFAIDVFCHPRTVNKKRDVSSYVDSSYSKGYISINDTFSFGRTTGGCADVDDVTYTYSTITLIPSDFSDSYVDFKQDRTENSNGVVVVPQTFKLIQSKEGIDRRL